MNSLIIGGGEVGTALQEVLINHYPVWVKGKEPLDLQPSISPKIMHICFPYTDEFVSEVERYQELYKPKYTVIHSTVPLGTSRRCKAYHSPIRGVHPHLKEGLLTFIKYLAPKSEELKEYFEKTGIKIKLVDKSENTEALKIWSTTQYGRYIELEKEIYKYCEDNDLDFDLVYGDSNKTYNEGYEKLGMGHVRRPILKQVEGAIGGHCVLQNYELLNNKEYVQK